MDSEKTKKIFIVYGIFIIASVLLNLYFIIYVKGLEKTLIKVAEILPSLQNNYAVVDMNKYEQQLQLELAKGYLSQENYLIAQKRAMDIIMKESKNFVIFDKSVFYNNAKTIDLPDVKSFLSTSRDLPTSIGNPMFDSRLHSKGGNVMPDKIMPGNVNRPVLKPRTNNTVNKEVRELFK